MSVSMSAVIVVVVVVSLPASLPTPTMAASMALAVTVAIAVWMASVVAIAGVLTPSTPSLTAVAIAIAVVVSVPVLVSAVAMIVIETTAIPMSAPTALVFPTSLSRRRQTAATTATTAAAAVTPVHIAITQCVSVPFSAIPCPIPVISVPVPISVVSLSVVAIGIAITRSGGRPLPLPLSLSLLMSLSLLVWSLVVMMHGMTMSPCVVRQHRRRPVLLDHTRHQTPQHNADAAPAVLLRRRQRVDAVFPLDVDVPTETEQHTIRLWEVDACLVLCVKERQLSCRTKRHTHRDVLIERSMGIERCGVVVGRFPIARIAVPIEPCTHRLLCDTKVFRNLFLDHLICFGTFGILGNEVSAFVPANPF